MTEELTNHPEGLDHNDYEREDLSPAGVMYFMAGLAVVVIAIYLIVSGMYSFLDRYERTHLQGSINPMVPTKPDTRIITPEDPLSFPQPRLETDERTQFNGYIEKQEQTLLTYGWVDKDSGVARIPIDRAMDLIAQRGLPFRQEGTSSAAAAPKKESPSKPATKAAAAPGN